MSERKSEVMVVVLDFSEVEAKAVQAYMNQHPDAQEVEAKVRHKWGIVETPRGLFALCDEGVMLVNPISDDNKLPLDIFVSCKTENGHSIPLFPSFCIRGSDSDLRECMSEEKVNLAEFIRSFSGRLECNFDECNKALSEELGLEVLA